MDPPLESGPEQPVPGRNARLALGLAVAVTVALYFVPYGRYIAYPLLLISTFVHEMGHGIAALLVGAHFEHFVMYPDASGVAGISGGSGRLAGAVIAAGGLVGPSIGAAVLFVLSTRERLARAGLWLIGIAALVSCLWVVRNLFGWIFVGLLGVLAILLAIKAASAVAQWALAFAAVQLTLSVYSRADYLFTPTARTASGLLPSDVALISKALLLPYWFWGGVCAIISLSVLGFGLNLFWRVTRDPNDQRR